MASLADSPLDAEAGILQGNPTMKRLKGRWFMLLFALPFAAAGMGVLLFGIVPNLIEWQQMKSWTPVEAWLHSAELVSSRSEDSTTYRVDARYHYEYGGYRYEGQRVGIMGGSDNIGDFHHVLAARLEHALRTGTPVPAWVDPANPADAVLNRDMRWDALAFSGLITLLFGGVGFGLLAWTLLVRPLHVEHPDAASRPWLARRDWADNHIACSGKGSLWFVWAFALFWNGLSAPALYAVPGEFAKGNHLILVALIFPLIGLVLLVWAIRNTLSWRRFGQLAVVMDPFPGAIGGQVGGHVDVPLPFDVQQLFSISLSCVHSYESGSGKNRSRKETVLWQGEGLAHAEPTAKGTRLSFCFDVPDALPASEPPSSDYHLWRLTLEADLPGVDLSRHFELPVFPTGEHSSAHMRSSTRHPKAIEQRASQIEQALDYREIPGGVELFSPMLRNPAGWSAGLLFGAIFGGAGWSMFRYADDAPATLVWGCMLVGGVIVFFTVLAMFSSVQARLDGEGLCSQRFWLGVPVGRTWVRRDEIHRLEIESSYRQQIGSKTIEVFHIRAVTRSGRNITIAKNLKGREVARQALTAIAGRCGYPAGQ